MKLVIINMTNIIFSAMFTYKYRQYKLGNLLKRPDMQINAPVPFHCGKVSLNRDRLPTRTRRS